MTIAKSETPEQQARRLERNKQHGAKWRAANPRRRPPREPAERAAEAKKRYIRTLREAGCFDCGTADGDLHFHHLDPSTKVRSVAGMYGCSWERIEAEVAKCVVVCEPCHRERHRAMAQSQTL